MARRGLLVGDADGRRRKQPEVDLRDADEESAGEGSPAEKGRFSFLWAFVCVFVAPVREVETV